MTRTYTDLSVEPPVGTVAAVNVMLSQGVEGNGAVYRRHAEGWSTEYQNHRGFLETWEDLTSLDLINERIGSPTPRHPARAVSVTVTIIGGGLTVDEERHDTLMGAARYLSGMRRTNGHRYTGFELAAYMLEYAAQDLDDGFVTEVTGHINAVAQIRVDDEREANLAADTVASQAPAEPVSRTLVIDEAVTRLNGWMGAMASRKLSAEVKRAARAGDPAARSILALSSDATVSAVAALLEENRERPTAAAAALAAAILNTTTGSRD